MPKMVTIVLGREKRRCSQLGTWGSTGPATLLARTGRTLSKTRRIAGTSAKVYAQQSSIPIPPMNPKCRNPRLAARINTPKETLEAAESNSGAAQLTNAREINQSIVDAIANDDRAQERGLGIEVSNHESG